jgi:hypothetical protein
MAEVNPIDVQRALSGADYPADKNDLVERARHNGADDTLVKALHDAPQDRFDGPDQVQKAIFSKGR